MPLINESKTSRCGGDALTFVGVVDLWSSKYDPVSASASVRGVGPVIGLMRNPEAVIHQTKVSSSSTVVKTSGLPADLQRVHLDRDDRDYPIEKADDVQETCG